MKLNYKKTIKVGLAFAIVMVFWTAYDYVVPLLLEDAFGLSNTMRGLIMGLDNLLSLFMLPLFGKISDKTMTKYGRRTPFIVIGTLLSVLLMIFVPVSAINSLNEASDLRSEITVTYEEGYTYEASDGTVYDAEALYTYIYGLGATNTDYCDYSYMSKNDINTLEDYLEVALNPFEVDADGNVIYDEDGEASFTTEYNNFVVSGLNAFASQEVNTKITSENPMRIVVYMVILFFVLMAMATFRSPAVALMPDVTPKPLRSQANAMISLVGGIGGAVAFLIYTIVLMINPSGYVMIFGLVALAMILLLVAFLLLVKEKKLVAENVALCEEYGITDDEDEEGAESTTEEANVAVAEPKMDKAKRKSFLLILASIFMWFMGYNAISSNLSIYLTTTLNLSSGLGGIISGVSMGISAVAFIPVGMLAVKIGRKKSIILGFILSTIAFFMIYLFASSPNAAAMYLFTAFYLISGFGLIITNVNTFPMVVELSTTSTVGKYTGYYYTATMSAQAVTPFIAGVIMDAFGNSSLFVYSTICVILAIVCMALVKHGDSKAVPTANKLEMFADAAD